MLPRDSWRELAEQFLNAKRKSESDETFESLARRAASWLRSRPRGDLYEAWMKLIRKRNRGETPTDLARWDLSADICNLMEREGLEHERALGMWDARSAPDREFGDPIGALEARPNEKTEAPAGFTPTAIALESETTGEQIDRLRNECRLSVEQLAEMVKIEPRSVYRHINGEAKPRIAHIGAYERAFSQVLHKPVVISITSQKVTKCRNKVGNSP